jgi:UDP-N-acetylglucosamine--N-acetylmuramyl-(pentapeptide) pyrophosphoryl-undecaprenol N-acetylglucosamine transferase
MVMAGGTGGHVFPALAVAQEMRSRGWDVFWLGTRNGLEARVVPEAGFDMVWLSISGLRGSGILRLITTPFMLLRAFFQSFMAILARRPDVVLGMGGYTAFPGGLMASLLGKRLVVHEQNAVAGLTNRVLACLSDRVLAAFPDAFNGPRDKPIPCRKIETRWVGNPVRTAIAQLAQEEHRYAGRAGPLRLLVVGGSLGASALNSLLPAAIALIPAERRPEVIHQSGRQHLEILRRHYEDAGVHADTRDFIEDMASLYGWCDLAVCRAGAMTIAELACAGVPAILVPFPFAVDDHQTANARFLSDGGAAWLIQQKELTPTSLATLLMSVKRETLTEMSCCAHAVAKPESTRAVADACEEVAE